MDTHAHSYTPVLNLLHVRATHILQHHDCHGLRQAAATMGGKVGGVFVAHVHGQHHTGTAGIAAFDATARARLAWLVAALARYQNRPRSETVIVIAIIRRPPYLAMVARVWHKLLRRAWE